MGTGEFELQILVKVRRKGGFGYPLQYAKDIAENIQENLGGELELMEIDADEVVVEVVK